MPSQLGKLENLLDLSLQHGASGGEKLSGAMPSQMGSLLKLTALQVQQNALSGPIPSEVVYMVAVVVCCTVLLYGTDVWWWLYGTDI